VDIVVRGRHLEVPERFRVHATDKLAKLEKFEQRPLRVDVEVSKERNPRQADVCDRVELTAHSRGPVIRAEAAADDPYAALDLAYTKLENRVRKMADRRRVHHGNRRPTSLSEASAVLPGPDPLLADGSQPADGVVDDGGELEDGPMIVREKVHQAVPMSLDQALYEMELVGHDFFLFVDDESSRPSVVYRRHAYDYGVIRLEV
jgi:ribosomal subunit interface protein